MNEASSKYVDQIATEKLLNEKLRRVNHLPGEALKTVNSGFDDFAQLPEMPSEISQSAENISFRSTINSGYPENDRVYCRVYTADRSAGNVIFIHGLYEDNLQIYNYFISQLNELGLNVFLMMLPFHYDRKPKASLFSGEYFWSGNIYRSELAFKQSVYDLYQLFNLVRRDFPGDTGITGFSMGGGISLRLATLTDLPGVFCINPVCNIAGLVWEGMLFSTIKQDLLQAGFNREVVKNRFDKFEPLAQENIATRREKIALGRGNFDLINPPENYQKLVEKWKIEMVIDYKAGHLNILRVPRLAPDVHRFLTRKAVNELL